MSIEIFDDYIQGPSNIGINKDPGSFTLDVNGQLSATSFNGNGANLSGITKGHAYNNLDRFNLTVGGSSKVVKNYNVSIGQYMIFFHFFYNDFPPGGDEDAGQLDFRLNGAGGTVTSGNPRCFEQTINGGNNAGLTGLTGMAYANITSAGNIALYFTAHTGDTDGGGLGGQTSVLFLKRS